MESKENIFKISNWEIVFDSYQRPIIKSNEKNFLLLELVELDQEFMLANKKYILVKSECVQINNKYKNDLVRKLENFFFKRT